MWRGEQLELVYVFTLRVYKDLRELGAVLKVLGYDNACKLLLHARSRRHERPPLTEQFVDDLTFVLDNFHRGNHTWCLQHLPEVDPKRAENQQLMGNKNTEACEQLNSWITCRTRSSLDMPPGRFMVYWWTLLSDHNDWLETEAACMRRRFARGNMQHDPDVPRHKDE